MRFQARQRRTTSGQVKPTQPGTRLHRQFDSAEILSRRSFTSLLGEPKEEKIASITSMDMPVIEATDKTKGGLHYEPRGIDALGIPAYSITNLTKDRTYNANASSTAELADVLGTLIGDATKALNEVDKRLKKGGL